MSKARRAGVRPPIPKELAGSSYWAGGMLVQRTPLPEEVIKDVAEWMAAEVERVGYLEHETAACQILDKYGAIEIFHQYGVWHAAPVGSESDQRC
jgi:hypothetical protein